jgi:FtsP/CotA-like multicopper oxidase with cupredoxin domain
MLRIRAALVLCLGISLLAGICAADASPSLPAVIENQNHAAAGRLDHGVFTLRLELRRGLWHPEAPDGRAIEVMAFAEEGGPLQTPGPLIRVPQSTEIHASVHNALTTKMFVHGLHLHPAKGDDCLELAPGETKEVRFLAGEPGTYLYWAATENGTIATRFREDTLMSGAFIVDAPGATVSDRVMIIQLWAKDLYRPTFDAVLSINGKSWPHTERLNAQLGEAEHWRILNATPLPHPMHLHGFYFHVDSVGDGETDHRYTEAERRMAVTELVEAGHTFEMTWVPDRAGSWVFHCHILDHMMRGYKAPWLYGPDGPPASMQHTHDSDEDSMAVGMGDLVMGIHVADNKAHLVPASATVPPPATHKDLFVRERKSSPYVPGGPGFYLQGVSTEVGAVGPPLVVTRGERTAITVHNELNEPTAIHWHGIEIESYYDGVPGWTGTPQRTTPQIPPGESFVAYMTPPRAGTFIYHTHWHDVNQLTSGMYGALVVLEPGQKYDPTSDKVFVLGRGGVNEMKDPMLVNGSAQPGLMVLLSGQTYRFRFVNITPNDRQVDTSIRVNGHPFQWRALAKDGAALPPQQATMRDAVQVISVGETYDFEFSPKEPGDYEMRFCSDFGTTVTQMITVVPREHPFSAFAEKR